MWKGATNRILYMSKIGLGFLGCPCMLWSGAVGEARSVQIDSIVEVLVCRGGGSRGLLEGEWKP